jgi:hypothetical protein
MISIRHFQHHRQAIAGTLPSCTGWPVDDNGAASAVRDLVSSTLTALQPLATNARVNDWMTLSAA